MDRIEYCDRVISVLRRAAPEEKKAIRAEIDAHIEDHICDLLDLGYDEALAEERTMVLMGDPEEVGRELDKQYPLRWLMISRIAAVMLTLVVLLCMLGFSSLMNVYSNIQARIDPWSDVSASAAEKINRKLDIRQEIGSDILHIMGSGTKVTEDGAVAVILYCKYDKNPFGYVTEGYQEIEYVDYRGDVLHSGSGGGHSNAGAEYWRRSVAVQHGDPYVTMVYQRFGTRHEFQIPLEWEGEA